MLYQQGVEEAQQEAKLIVTTAQEQAAAQQRQTTANLSQVALYIVELVLPAEYPIPSAVDIHHSPNTTGET